jgi:transposase
MTRRTFSRDFKLAAVNKVVVQGMAFSEVAHDLGVRDTLIHKWKQAFETDGTISIKAQNGCSVEEELKRLREENRQLKIERDILKKATAFFAKENS